MATDKQAHNIEKGKGWHIEYAPCFADATTIRLGGTAIAHLMFSEEESVSDLLDFHKRLGGKLTPMGCGSNIIAKDGDLPLTLVSMVQDNTVEILSENKDTVSLKVSAGMRLPALQSYAATKGFSGLEGLCGIPGNLGGALSMNAGSSGIDMSSVLTSLTAFTEGAGLTAYTREELSMEYRKVIFPQAPQWFFITSAVLLLTKKTPDEVRSSMKASYLRKQLVQPLNAPSAGCVFKNPEGNESAGKVLDSLGFKGKKLGGMEFSSKHANFLINTGTGTASEAYELIALAQEKVLAEKEIHLQTEVKLWP